MTTSRLTIGRPDDWHLHLRDGAALGAVVAHTAAVFGRAVVAGEQPPRRGDERPPPVVRRLFRAAARQHVQLDGLSLPGGDAPINVDERDLGARRAEVHGEDVPRCAGHRLRPFTFIAGA